jgi:hypothetical protein
MKKSSGRKKNVKKHKLSVERLESRTVLSATNLLATAIEFAPDRVDLRSRPDVIGSHSQSHDSHSRHGVARGADQQTSRVHNRFEQNSHDKGSKNRHEPRSTIPPPSSVSFGIVPRADASSFRPNDNLIGALPTGDLNLSDTVSPPAITAGLEARAEPRAVPPAPPLLLVFEDTARGGTSEQADLIEPRGSDGLTGRVDQATVNVASERSENLTAPLVSGLPSPNASLDRFFELLDLQSGDEALNRESNTPPLQSSELRSTTVAMPLDVASDLATGFALSADLAYSRTLLPAGGLIELPSQPLSSAGDELEGYRQKWTSNDLTQSSSRQPTVGSELSASQGGDWLDDTANDLSDLLAEISPTYRRLSSTDTWPELDLAQTDETMAARRGSANMLPEDDAWWYGEFRRTLDSFWLEFGQDVESQLAIDVDEHLAEGPTEMTQIAAAEMNVEEGGMIELVAAAFYDANDEPAHPAGQQGTSTTGEVQMDTGIGMFQAFELATTPQAEPEQPASGEDATAETTAADATDEALPAEQPVAIADESDAESNRSASAPALLVAATLSLRRKRHRQMGPTGLQSPNNPA